MEGWAQVQALLKSRKFWAMVTGILAAAAALGTNQIDTWQFIIAVVTAMAAYSTGVAIEDAGAKIGAGTPAGARSAAQFGAGQWVKTGVSTAAVDAPPTDAERINQGGG